MDETPSEPFSFVHFNMIHPYVFTNCSQVSVAFIVFDAILWNNKTRDMTPFEIMTTFEGK